MVLRTAVIMLAAVLGELGGVYAVWRWRKLGASIWLVPLGLAALLAYAVVQTYQPEIRFGRVYAAYAGVFLLGAMAWGSLPCSWTRSRRHVRAVSATSSTGASTKTPTSIALGTALRMFLAACTGTRRGLRAKMRPR